jgi:hypothetical protein
VSHLLFPTRSRFGLTAPVFLRAFRWSDSALDKIYFN